MTANEFIFSNAHSLRLIRHASFWGFFGILYYAQSVVPVQHPFFTAWVSFCCFFPACIFAAYFSLLLLLPLAKNKRYVAFLAATTLLICCVVVLNYFGSMVFFNFTCDCNLQSVDRWKIVGLDLNNSLHAISTAGLISGFRVAKSWIAQQKVSLDMLNQRVANEMNLEKIRLHPRFTLESLSHIREEIDSGSTHGPKLILKLSEVLSYLLYESQEQRISLKHEIEMTENLLYLEQQRSGQLITHGLNGENTDKLIKPLLLFSLVRNCLDAFRTSDQKPSTIRFELTCGDQLHLDIGVSLPKGLADLPGLRTELDAIKNKQSTVMDQNNHIRISHSFN